MLVFLSVIEIIVVPLSIFSVVFAHAHVVLLTIQKSRRAEKKFHNARSLQEIIIWLWLVADITRALIG